MSSNLTAPTIFPKEIKKLTYGELLISGKEFFPLFGKALACLLISHL